MNLIALRSFEDNAGRSDPEFRVVMRNKGDVIADTDLHRKLWHPRFLDYLVKNGFVRVEGAANTTAPDTIVRPPWAFGP